MAGTNDCHSTLLEESDSLSLIFCTRASISNSARNVGHQTKEPETVSATTLHKNTKVPEAEQLEDQQTIVLNEAIKNDEIPNIPEVIEAIKSGKLNIELAKQRYGEVKARNPSMMFSDDGQQNDAPILFCKDFDSKPGNHRYFKIVRANEAAEDSVIKLVDVTTSSSNFEIFLFKSENDCYRYISQRK